MGKKKLLAQLSCPVRHSPVSVYALLPCTRGSLWIGPEAALRRLRSRRGRSDSGKLRLPMALSHLSPLRHQWARPQPSVFRVRRSSGQSVFFRYFDMRCEYSKVVCDGKVMALLTKWKKRGSFKPHTIEKLKSILPNSKIDLVQLLAFSKLAKEEMKRGEKPTKMQKILHRLSVLQHLTLAIHFAEGVLCFNRYQDAGLLLLWSLILVSMTSEYYSKNILKNSCCWRKRLAL